VIAEQELQKTSPVLMAGVDRALGELYTAQGRIAEAIDVNEKALAITLHVTPGGLAEADIAQHLGELLRSKGDWATAERYYRESLQINERLLPDTADVAENLHGLGLVARHGGKEDEALNLLTRAVDALEAQSARLGGSELVNAGFRASYSQYYRDLAEMLITLNQANEAFTVTERYRARTFLDQLAQRKLTLSGAPPELTAQLHANAEQYESVQNNIRRLSQTQHQAQLDQLKAQLVDLSATRADAIARIRRQSPRFAALRLPSTLSAAQAQASLDPGTELISFLVEPQMIYVFVLGPPGSESSVATFSIPIGESGLRAKVQAFRLAIQGSGKENRRLLRQEAKELYDLLLRPAEASLGRSERILILPDGPLYELPFPALLRDDHYLAEWKPVSTTLSATLFAQLKQQRRLPDTYRVSLAAFGDAVYQSSQTANTGQPSSGGQQRSAAGEELTPLRFSKPEAEQIAQLFPGRSQLYERQSATEENAKKLGSDVRFIHFAVHGLLDEEHPLDSALAFTTPSRSHAGGDNGYLQAWELYQDAHWDADMVVLSACQSALGKESAGEGLIGLTRAVHYAGARSVLSSLWNIDDEKTEEFMTTLYAGLRDGLPKDEAVRAAQLKMIHSRGGEAPYYWAAFTLQGDWK
jgi:CHAT domain-containing protein